MLLLSHAWEGDSGNLAVVVEPYEQAQRISALEKEFHDIKGLILYPAVLSDLAPHRGPIGLEVPRHFLHRVVSQGFAERGRHLCPVDLTSLDVPEPVQGEGLHAVARARVDRRYLV